MLEIGYCNKIVHRYGVSVPQDVICNNNSAKRRNISHQSTLVSDTSDIPDMTKYQTRNAGPLSLHMEDGGGKLNEERDY